MTEQKSVSPLVAQIILRTLGQYASTYLGNDTYYLIKAIYHLKEELGEDYLKPLWEKEGNNWDLTMRMLIKLDKKSTEAKAFYDSIDDKRFDNKTKDIKVKRYYLKSASKIPALKPEAYKFFIFMLKNCAISRMQIRNEYFKIIENSKYMTMGLGNRRQMPTPNMQIDIPVDTQNMGIK